MKQTLTLFAAILLLAVGATAQKLSYQAVVRNDANELVAGATVQVTVSVLNATGDVQYAENHANVQTNLNGLLSLMIGDGTPTGTATMADVVWTGASVKTIITLPGGVSVTSVTPVNAVPYALYADNVNPANLPTVPENISAFNNDAGYISAEQCGGVDICALVALVSTLQNQVAELQSTIDSLIALNTTGGGITPDDTTEIPVDTSTTSGIPCPNAPTVTDVDGNVYNTVMIGEQCWMAENLRTTKYSDNSPINQGYWYYPGGNQSNKLVYGLLYNWTAVMHGASSSNSIPSGVQGICPTGWHVPSDAEWYQLTTYLESQGIFRCGSNNNWIAKSISSKTGWSASSNTCSIGYLPNDNNVTGFGAVPSGTYLGGSYLFGNCCDWWTTTEKNNNEAFNRYLDSFDKIVKRDGNQKGWANAVRCLRDTGVEPSDTTSSPSDTTEVPADTTVLYGQPCPNAPTVTDHEGNVYNTVQIGTQCWTRENLRTTTSPITGTYLIPPANTTYTYTGKQARWFNNDSITYAPKNYGLLYNYNAAIDTYNLEFGETSVVTAGDYERGFDFVGHRRGICPLGWHLPSDEEWTTLAYYVSSQDSCVSEFATYNNRTWIAKALASTTDWNNSINTAAVGNNQQTNNITGFSALPSGGYGFLGYGVCGFMRNVGDYANFWSTNHLYPRIFINGNQFVARGEGYGTLSCFSVRCLRDEDSGSSPTLVVDEKPCPNTPTVTDVDGNVYNAVMIGEQCWMKENLRTTHYANGDTILFGNARKYPNNDQSNVAEYGYLYQWYATMHLDNSYQGQTLDIQGICPTGWHVPSYTEWGALADYAGQNYYGLIASTGFSTQLAGRYWDGYHNFGERNYFWTRDYVVNQAIHYRFMDDAMNLSSNGETENAYAFFSVRCLRD